MILTIIDNNINTTISAWIICQSADITNSDVLTGRQLSTFWKFSCQKVFLEIWGKKHWQQGNFHPQIHKNRAGLSRAFWTSNWVHYEAQFPYADWCIVWVIFRLFFVHTQYQNSMQKSLIIKKKNLTHFAVGNLQSRTIATFCLQL